MPIRYVSLENLGYRGRTLLMFGAMFVVIGLGALANPGPDPYLWHTQLPIWFRLLVWCGAGAVAALSAFHPRFQPFGFAALFVGPAERFVSFAGSIFLEPSMSRLPGAALYLLLALTVAHLASWPEPSQRNQ